MKREVENIPLEYKDGHLFDPNLKICAPKPSQTTAAQDIRGAYYCKYCEVESAYRCYFTKLNNLIDHEEMHKRPVIESEPQGLEY